MDHKEEPKGAAREERKDAACPAQEPFPAGTQDRKKPRGPRRAWLWRALTVVCAAVFCVSAGMAAFLWIRGQREESAFRDLASIVHASSSPAREDGAAEPETASETGPGAGESSADGTRSEASSAEPETDGFEALRALNSDFFGWLTIEGTGVDYPVMFTPDDPEYYLRRDFEGNPAQSGVPFLDGAWTQDCGHYLLYGHNMDNGTMFAPILEYRDRAYFDEHPVIRFETEDGPAEYEIFAVFYSQVYPVGAENVFRYYYCTDLSTQEAFDSYVSQAKAASLYDTGVAASFGDTILTLSTCSYHTQEGRFVVTAVKR